MAESTKQEGARTVGRVLKALELFSSQAEPVRLTDVAKTLELPPSSAYALLQQLIRYDYVRAANNERRYVQGPALALLGTRVRSGMQLVRIARPVIEEVAAATGENVYLGVRQARGIAYADAVEAEFGVMARYQLGVLRPLHATGPGKIFLAFHVPKEQLDEVLGPSPLPSYTRTTITDRAALRRQLDRIRHDGYAVNEQEIVEDAFGVSAPIFGADHALQGCVTVGMPGVRYRAHFGFAIEKVKSAAIEISRHLGVADWQQVLEGYR